jgi:alkylation response protein AidB-like acyl-CoA dehydrogenase
MDFSFSPEQRSFRRQVRAFFRAAVTPDLLDRLERDGEEHAADFHKAVAARGWIGLQWPAEVGGLAATDVESAILMEEASYAGAPMTGYLVAVIAGSTILRVGTPEQVRRFLPGIAAGDLLFSLGYTEPGSGSDLASLSTRAERDGDGWRLHGAKTFTSLAHEADVALVAGRTDPTVGKHKGLTVFALPLDRPGISIAPIHTLGGFRTNSLTLDNVPVGPDDVLGGVDNGWATLGAALDLERTGASRLGLCRRLLDHVWSALGDDDPLVRAELADLELRLTASRLLSYRAAWMVSQGRLPTAEAAMAKVVSTELAQHIAGTAIRLLGPAGLADGLVEQAYRNSARFTVTAGTSEIQRSIVARRLLGLPKGA